MRLRELLQQRAEDGELRLERLGVGGAQRGAVRGVVRRRDARAVEGADAHALARHGGRVGRRLGVGGVCMLSCVCSLGRCELLKVACVSWVVEVG